MIPSLGGWGMPGFPGAQFMGGPVMSGDWRGSFGGGPQIVDQMGRGTTGQSGPQLGRHQQWRQRQGMPILSKMHQGFQGGGSTNPLDIARGGGGGMPNTFGGGMPMDPRTMGGGYGYGMGSSGIGDWIQGIRDRYAQPGTPAADPTAGAPTAPPVAPTAPPAAEPQFFGMPQGQAQQMVSRFSSPWTAMAYMNNNASAPWASPYFIGGGSGMGGGGFGPMGLGGGRGYQGGGPTGGP